MTDTADAGRATPWHLWVVGVLSLLWNAYGGYDYWMSHTDPAAYLPTPAPQPASIELRDLARALDALPEEQHRVVMLVGLEGLTYEETAGVLGVPIGTVMSRLSRGREALRRMTDGEQRVARREGARA